MMQAEWLPVVMQASSSEIYVYDAQSLRMLHANAAACASLGIAEPAGLPAAAVMTAASADALLAVAQSLRSQPADGLAYIPLTLGHLRRDGSGYALDGRIAYCGHPVPVLLVIGDDITDARAAAEALRRSEARFHAISANTPGLVYQFRLHGDGDGSFTYLSDGCHALLGLAPEELQADAGRFMSLVVPEDRASYIAAMTASRADMKAWNWEGRLNIAAWNDIKWINLRAMPSLLPDGSVQWDGIMTNITQSKLEQAEIRRSRAQLAELSAHIQTVKEKERARIAREIHDDLGGNLTAIKMALALLARRLPEGDLTLIDKANYVDALIDRSIEAVHRIAGDLRPGVLDFGIVEALAWQVGEFGKQAGIQCGFTCPHKEIDLDLDTATALFRIAQEAMTNIAKHARATRVDVRLVRAGNGLQMEIADNGRGIAEADRNKPASFGIRGMHERAAALHGTLAIDDAPGGGTVVTIRIPLTGIH